MVRAEEGLGDMVDFRDHFPQFLWLLRDVSLKATDQSGTQLAPTDYLKTQVLWSRYATVPDTADTVATCIMNYFPSVECRFLPLPSGDKNILQNMEDDSVLSDEFTQCRDEVKQFIFQSVDLKRGFNRNAFVTGPVFASLAEQYVPIINTPGQIIAIENCWENAVKASLNATSDSLVKKYRQTMEVKLSLIELPIEESIADSQLSQTLMGMHSLTFRPLCQQLKKEFDSLMPPNRTTTDTTEQEKNKQLLQQFEQRIVEYDDGVISGGELYPFVQENRKKSQEQCEGIFNELYAPIKQRIDEKMQNPGSKYSYADVLKELKTAYETYSVRAVGPAKEEVFKAKGDAVVTHCDSVFKVADTYGTKLFEKTCEADAAKTEVKEIHLKYDQTQEKLATKEAEVEELRADKLKRTRELTADFDRTLEMERNKQEDLTNSKMDRAKEASQAKTERLVKEYTENIASLKTHYKDEHQTLQQKIHGYKEGIYNYTLTIIIISNIHQTL